MNSVTEREISEALELARKHLGRSSGDLELPDPIAHEDINSDWKNHKNRLAQSIMNEDCSPSHVEIVDLPKDRLTVRPLARLDIEHRLVYDAAVFAAADAIQSATPTGVYSYRWWKREQRLLGPGGMWLKMQRAGKTIHEKNPQLLAIRTDISAYYENIEIDLLLDDLAALDIPKWSLQTLRSFLHAFNGLSHAWGIPQGSDASGLLANLYLVPLDALLSRLEYRHLRYSDDIFIFGKDWISLREVLLGANRLLRYRHLNIAGSKTNILSGAAIKDHFEDREKDAISYGVDIRAEWAPGELRKFFDRISQDDPLSPRDLRFSFTQLRRLKDPHAVEWLLDNMGEIPHVAREALVYLNEFHNRVLGDAVVDLLVNSKLTIYPYAEQHPLIYMIRNGVRNRRAISTAWNLLLNKNKESFVREFAARYLGLNAPPGEASALRQEFQSETNKRVRRAMLIACYEARQCPDAWLKVISDSDPAIRMTADYLHNHPTNIPFPVIERRYSDDR
ncbi:RNA-directed DNA polymerase [Streptosporangium saharense]|uniref:RNA-directed DNA polymerase n=1 Tax=Streptosporangium saharense TaxID=1706840 RepID=UPI0036A3E094